MCHKYHHQRIRHHQNGTDAGLVFWVIELLDFFSIFVCFFFVNNLTIQMVFECILLYESSSAETRLTVAMLLPWCGIIILILEVPRIPVTICFLHVESLWLLSVSIRKN